MESRTVGAGLFPLISRLIQLHAILRDGHPHELIEFRKVTTAGLRWAE
jgi:hypothetical protein